MSDGRIVELARELEAQGVESGSLRSLQEELDAIERPPGIFRRFTNAFKAKAATNWKHVVGELTESREVMGILSARLKGERQLTPEEVDKIRSQMLDVLRVVPAGIIAVANSALPIPGTGLFTPWILARLGLMPSRWREAHLLHALHGEIERLHAEGHDEEAEAIEELLHDLEEEADAREDAAREAALLTFWDANQNGIWDADERVAYEAEAAQLRAVAFGKKAANKRWFLQLDGQVFGPYRLSDVVGDDPPPPNLLACLDGKSGWVALEDLLPRED
jgi:hypothetical protein